MSKPDIAYVRTQMLPEAEPPATEKGVIKWLRENLFDGPWNTALTLVSLFVLAQLLIAAVPWFWNSVWNTSSLAECRAVLDGTRGACFSVLTERWHQLLFGFTYPSSEYWRPTLAFVLLIVAAAPVLFSKLPRPLLIFTGVYPFLAFWLIWGGTILTPLFALLGFVAAYFIFVRVEGRSFALAVLAGLVGMVTVWWLGGRIVASGLDAATLLPVRSRDLGGFMVNMMLGTVCVSLSLPIGILLALGRQSSLPIIKWICVVYIEFIRGVPLITLLFVANVVLAYFLPPGTNFDLILRVIIMITMFSSAYIAEVIRGGLAALPRGQYEAGDSLGLDYAQSMRLIILPQALKISIPGIVNVAVGLFKDTTLVSIISMYDLVGIIRNTIPSVTAWQGIYWETWTFAIVVFFVICYGISQYSQWLERQLQRDHR